jgi:hypothetical protein
MTINKNRIIVYSKRQAGRWWLTPVILATQEVEIRRIVFQGKPLANSQDPILKKPQ